MSNLSGAPNGIERRAYRNYNLTLNNITPLDEPRPTIVKVGDPLKKCSSRAHFVQLLEGQIEHSLNQNYPLCLALVEFHIESNFEDLEPVLYSVAQQFSHNLRPTDIIIRYQTKTLALILHEADETGGKVAADRLTKKLAGALKVGTEEVRITPFFGFNSTIARDSDRAEKLLANAETALGKAHKNNSGRYQRR